MMTAAAPSPFRAEVIVITFQARTGINGCSAIAHPLTHLTHGIPTRRPFHPAKTAKVIGGRFFNWVWLDPIMGIVGALFIAYWSRGLIVSAGAVLLDTVPNQNLVAAIRERLECGDDRVSDLHLWRLGPGHSGLIVTIIS